MLLPGETKVLVVSVKSTKFPSDNVSITFYNYRTEDQKEHDGKDLRILSIYVFQAGIQFP
jgi:hypothetical protein